MAERPTNPQAEWVTKKLAKEIGGFPEDFKKISVEQLVAIIIEYGREYEENMGVRDY